MTRIGESQRTAERQSMPGEMYLDKRWSSALDRSDGWSCAVSLEGFLAFCVKVGYSTKPW